MRQRDVARHRQRGDQALGLAIFRQQADAFANGVGGRAKRDGLAVAEDAPGIAAIGAGQHARQLGAARAEQPGDADHFTGAQAEADVVQRALAAEALDPQQLVAGVDATLGKVLLEIAIGHQPHELVDRDLRQQLGGDVPAVAQHRDATADAIHLVEAMRDVDHRHAARHQPRDQRKQLIDFARRQRRRRLVHHEDRRLRRVSAFAISTICRCARLSR